MSTTILIAGGAYVEAELEAEFGRLPPPFLPLGNRRLFLHQQRALAPHAGRLLLSLPADFPVEHRDAALLAELGIEIVPVPTGLSLGQSIVYVVNVTGLTGSPFAILHGDTLISGLDFAAPDVVSIAESAPPGLRWGYLAQPDGPLEFQTGSDGSGPVLSGWFSFSNATRLVQAITRRGGDFLGGLAEYARAVPLGRVEAEQWLDFGHASTYHRSRRRLTTERAFNRLTSTRRTVVKTSTDSRKIEAEARWYEALPAPMRVFTPAYLGRQEIDGVPAYELEFLHLPSLAEIHVFGQQPRLAWETIFSACDEFLSACAAIPAPDATRSGRDLFLDKTLERLERFAGEAGLDLASPCRLGDVALPGLERMARIAADAIPPPDRADCLAHGDFCFSNILYDLRAERVRAIDPRGLDGTGALSCFGDPRYDIAKLFHSVVGRYDHILAGYFDLNWTGPLALELHLPDTPGLRAVEDAFLSHRFAGMTPAEAAAHPIAVLLFLSMLPLHADDPRRQTALLANAMRLFHALDAPGGAGG